MNLTNFTTVTSYDTTAHTFMVWTFHSSIENYIEDISYWTLLGFLVLGIPLNVVAFFIWLIGPKSKTLCCATYFASNAVADFLCLAIPGISTYMWKIYYYHPYNVFHVILRHMP